MVNKETLSLLNRLKQTQAPVSGTALAQELGVSRVALWKRFEALRSAGYPVVADRSGYRLLASDKPLPWEFPEEAGVFHFDTVGSTMDEALRLALDGLSEGAVVAEHQNAGRGRADHRWVSEGGDLLVTLILRPVLPLSFVGALGLEALAALAETLNDLYGLEVTIKWPNDLMAGDLKVAGILVEACGPADRPRFYTVGLGLNVHGLPRVGHPAVSVEALGRPQADRRAILSGWRRLLSRWAADPTPDPARWAALTPPWRRTTFETFGGLAVSGLPQGFDRSGSLLLTRNDEIIPIRYGEGRTPGVAP
jgi:BirA family biotin operon repressor/biotin-[acetyl-CoA-carboxylase] ligase